MTQPTNIPPALQTLISEWTTVATSGCVAAYGVCAEGLRSALERDPVVHCSELRALAEKMDDVLANPACKTCSRWLLELVAKYTPQPPNPHPPGTYLWAREEHARGHVMRRNGSDIPIAQTWDAFPFTHSDFTATDWEVVS